MASLHEKEFLYLRYVCKLFVFNVVRLVPSEDQGDMFGEMLPRGADLRVQDQQDFQPHFSQRPMPLESFFMGSLNPFVVQLRML